MSHFLIWLYLISMQIIVGVKKFRGERNSVYYLICVFHPVVFQGAESLLPLLQLARERISEQYWSSTPLVLKATAGLRLLPNEKAEALLLQVRLTLLFTDFC